MLFYMRKLYVKILKSVRLSTMMVVLFPCLVKEGVRQGFNRPHAGETSVSEGLRNWRPLVLR